MRNWSARKKKFNLKKLGIISFVVVAVVVIIVVCVVLLTDDGSESDNGNITPSPLVRDAITLEDILEGRLTSRRFNGSWVTSNEITYRDLDGVVKSYNAETKKETVLLGIEDERLAEGVNFEVSADKRYLLVAREHQKIFRHSYAAKYDIVDLETQKVIEVKVHNLYTHLVYAEWSPIGNALIIVYVNNIYYKKDVNAEPIQITKDGGGSIYNGVPDWVYEEEVFSSNSALRFSPDGKKLAYVRFNDTPTILMGLSYYGIPGALEFQYPRNIIIPYPKAGSPNPIVNLYEVSLENLVQGTEPEIFELEVPDQLANKEHIISTVSWANNEKLVATWMNRVQNECYIQSCESNKCKVLTNLISKTGWIELFSQPIHNKAGTEMALIISQDQGGDVGGYRHLSVVKPDGTINALTKGKFIVLDILQWDTTNNLIFYMANTEADSKVLHLYAIKGDGNSATQCLTCNLKYKDENENIINLNYSYFDSTFSKSGFYLTLTALGPSIPRVDIFSYKVIDNLITLSHELEWEINPEVHEITAEKVVPDVIYHTIELSSGFTAKVMMVLPKNAELSGAVKYPMLVEVYGGPDSYNVINKWSMDWGSYLAANRKVILVKIDGRGSGLRGDKLLHTIYRHLGTVEIEDQIETTKKLQELPYVDKNHTGIWGWSYGGYASAMSLAYDDESVFRCAASVAPVTDWTYYDSIYTERYMGLPVNDNENGYTRSRLSTLSNEFRGKKFFMIHGTLDDNVHFQQAMALSRTLERNDVPFKLMAYPDEDHSLAGVRPHVYHSLGRFFGECFEMGNL